jgi:phosphoglycerate dehydrogenase-like enzyme
MLFFCRGFGSLLSNQQRRHWERLPVEELGGKRVGVIGLGEVGMAVARKLRSLDCVVIGCRRKAKDWDASILTRVYPPEQVGELLSEVQYVVVCAPLTEATRGMLGPSELRSMRSDAVLINVGRGKILDEHALVEALRSHQIKGAAIDVFHDEPLPPSSPFYDLDNVLISPQSADWSPEADHRVAAVALENVRRFSVREPLLNVVDKQAGY